VIDPRIERTTAAVLRSAADLWVEGGPGAVTVDAIVERSGVAKSTIYRHWRSRDDIMVDVVRGAAPDITLPDADLPFEAALREVMAQMVDVFCDPDWARILPALIMLKVHERSLYEVEATLRHEQLAVLADLVRRGVAAGRLPPGLDPNHAAAHLLGPLLFAHVSGDVEIDHDFGNEIVDRFIAGHRPES
jgi:AcrR family transcriptional regulator